MLALASSQWRHRAYLRIKRIVFDAVVEDRRTFCQYLETADNPESKVAEEVFGRRVSTSDRERR